jgi:hypothetical protein
MARVMAVLGSAFLLLTGLGAAPASAETAVVRVADLRPDHPRATMPDPDGQATASLELYRASGRLCWSIRFERMEVRRLAVFREAGAGEAIRLYDEAPTSAGSLSGCRSADPALLGEMADAPDRFYVRSVSYGGQDVAGTPCATRSARWPTHPTASTSARCPTAGRTSPARRACCARPRPDRRG